MPLRHSPYLPILIAALATLAPFSTDTYLPAFHALEAELAASPVQLQQTLSGYLAALATMLLFHGALSDAYGRRPVILVNLALFSVTSLACTSVHDVHSLTLLRIVQGFTGGAGIVVGRAIIRDLHEGPAAQRMMSQVTMWFSIAPAIAPIIGGLLLVTLGWRSIFGFMTFVGMVLLALSWRFLPETLPADGRQIFRPRPLLANYLEVLGNGRFRILSLGIAANFSGFFLYLASAPAFVGGLLHQPETRYAWLFVPGIAGIGIGARISGRVARHWSAERTIEVGYTIAVLAAMVNLAGNLVHAPALPWAVTPILLYAIGIAMISPSVTLTVLEFFPRSRGMASSLQAFFATLLNAFIAGAVSPLLSGSGVTLAAGTLSLSLIGLGAYLLYRQGVPRALAPAAS